MVTLILAACLHAAGLGLVTLLAWRATRDRVLAVLVASACLVRSVLAFTLYGLSAWRVPFLQELQLDQGFWAFAPDSLYYHEYARGAVVALRAGLELPYVYGSPDYPLIVAGIYGVFGPHPLFPIGVNIWLASLTVLLAYRLAHRLWTARSARVAAALVAFWPSSVFWSTQMLKDTICTFLVVAFLYAFSRLVDLLDGSGRESMRRTLVLAAGVFLALTSVYMLRYYIGLALLMSALAVLAATTATDLWRRKRTRVAASVAFATVLIIAVWLATWISSRGVAKPEDPMRASRQLAALMASTGDRDGALWQLQAALVYEKDAPRDQAERERLARVELEQLIARGGSSADGDAREAGAFVSSTNPEAAPAARVEFFKRVVGQLSLSHLRAIRAGFFEDTGSFVADPEESMDTLQSLVRLAPQALVNGLFAPHPWTRFNTPGSTGMFRRIAVVEAVLIAVLLYFSAAGARSLFRRQWQLAALVLVFSAIFIAALGYAVPTVGVLFRLRLAVLIPLCIVASGGRLPDYLARFRS